MLKQTFRDTKNENPNSLQQVEFEVPKKSEKVSPTVDGLDDQDEISVEVEDSAPLSEIRQQPESIATSRPKRDIRKPARYTDMVAYALPVIDGTSKPLLAVQVTELVDGIFIGISINHIVADATSFWHFVNSWSEISRGCELLSKPAPILQRWFLHDKDCPIHLPLFSSEQLNDKYVPPSLEQRVFHFSKENIAKLKAKANAEIGTNKISSFQALLSHFGGSLVRNKFIDDPNQEMKFRVIIGVRPRMNPPLPQHYFGNAFQGGIVTMKAKDLLEQRLRYVALEINKIIAMNTDEKVKDFLESWIENPEVTTIASIQSYTLILIGSTWVDVYGNDFGWGRPVAVRTGPGSKTDGTITVFPGVEQGSIDFDACLSPQTLQGMGNDAEFMDVVTASLDHLSQKNLGE
ncbi:hypothetical protein LWI28_004804 [Acer negundo]|uniref:Uncharacterized protein n=1 Tax=Acer negundo TaxID=4023 RepID=A0AAD5IM14_ACENE|nr:hypothetical protein LWI28_004804 [Acer negundo]